MKTNSNMKKNKFFILKMIKFKNQINSFIFNLNKMKILNIKLLC